jgi:hypothetical protein
MDNDKKNNFFLVVLLLLLLFGLSYFTWRRYQRHHPLYSPEINAVLFLAGDNRSELEKVLKHYGKNPADSLKLRAAEFLIVNMPGKYSSGYDAPFENVITALIRRDKITDKESLKRTFGLGEEFIRKDVKYITAEYLINNIELSFKVWKEQPWGKDVPFDAFCEEILPYRIGFEPLENWREKVLASFADLNQSFKKQPDITAVEACCKVNLQIPCPTWSTFSIPSNYSMLMTARRGSCDEIANLTTFVMRALGIPVTREYTPAWPNRDISHIWNAVRDSSGRYISFSGCELNPGAPHAGTYKPKNKAYRQTFAGQTHIQTEIENIPPELRNPFVKDVSMEYEEFREVKIPVRFPAVSPTKYVYLLSMGNLHWNTIGWGETDNQNMRFSISNRSVLYMPVYYSNNVLTPANYPFILDKEGKITYFESDTTQVCSVDISEISLTYHNWFFRMKSGVFEGANRSDFSDAQKLHTINDVPGNHFSMVKINNPNKFRYLRYVSPKDREANCTVAEINFFDSDGALLQGKPVGTGAFYYNPFVSHDKAFDGDVSTYYEARDNESWTGIDLGEAKRIGEIHYLPRNDDRCGIYKGDDYELFYWNNRQWQSLGIQKVSDYRLEYKKTPSHAIFYLRNVTKGINGGVFSVQDGQQKWM